MKNKINKEISKCCALCEHAKKVELTGELLCTYSKNIKKVSEDSVCRKFSFDILSYRPMPAKLPKFAIDSAEDFI